MTSQLDVWRHLQATSTMVSYCVVMLAVLFGGVRPLTYTPLADAQHEDSAAALEAHSVLTHASGLQRFGHFDCCRIPRTALGA